MVLRRLFLHIRVMKGMKRFRHMGMDMGMGMG
jgi:hypothetical protein